LTQRSTKQSMAHDVKTWLELWSFNKVINWFWLDMCHFRKEWKYTGVLNNSDSFLATEWQHQLQVQGCLLDLKQELKESYGYVVSNGSYHNQSGAAAWIIEGKTSTNWITGMIITPGCHTDQSSFQRKLAGIFGILLTLKALDIPQLKGMSCRIVCNGKYVLDHLQSEYPVIPSEFVAGGSNPHNPECVYDYLASHSRSSR